MNNSNSVRRAEVEARQVASEGRNGDGSFRAFDPHATPTEGACAGSNPLGYTGIAPDGFFFDASRELRRARSKYAAFNSGHEGYAVILEELEELWAKVMEAKNSRGFGPEFRAECIQIAAMAARFSVDLCASEPTIPAIYIAHPLGAGADRPRNRMNAARWCASLAKLFEVATVADWVVLSGEWNETEENRNLGLRLDLTLVSRCDELWLCGGRISPGMRMEAERALSLGLAVRDLTTLGYEPPMEAFALPNPVASLSAR